MVRVFTTADGSLRVLRAAVDTLDAVTARVPSLAGLPFVDVHEDDLPPRGRRDAWRLVNGRVQ